VSFIKQTFLINRLGNIKFENANVKTATGVDLSRKQKTLVSSVLDLFGGFATQEKLALWTDDGKWEDPLCIANGRKEYEAQWVISKPFSVMSTLTLA